MLTHTQRRLVNTFLGSFEKILFDPFIDLHKIEIEPIFLIGPPRSGTTIIAQWFIHFIDQPKTYISRIADLYPDAVLLLNKIFDSRSKVNLIESESKYGQIKGLDSMAEGNRLWPWYEDSLKDEEKKKYKYVYNRTQYSVARNITPDVIRFLNKVLKKQCYYHKTNLLINKSTHNTRKVAELKQIFPKAKFVAVIRDGRYVTRSMMTARKELLGAESTWWNIKPSNYDKIHHLPPHLSCAKQWSGLLKDIEDQFKELVEKDYTFIQYSDFISNPQESLNTLYNKFDLQHKLNNNHDHKLKAPKKVSELFDDQTLSEVEDAIGVSLEKWGFEKWLN